jgi:hypothetical protein
MRAARSAPALATSCKREHGVLGRIGCLAAGDHPHHRRQQARRVGYKPGKAGAATGAGVERACRVGNRCARGPAQSRAQRLERARLGGDTRGIAFSNGSENLLGV